MCSGSGGSDSDGSDDLFNEHDIEIEGTDSDDPDYLDELDSVMKSYENRSGQGESSSARGNVISGISEDIGINQQGKMASAPVTGHDSDGYETEELGSLHGSDDEEEKRGPPEFHDGAAYGQVHLELSMTFTTMNQFKEAVKDYTMNLGRFLKYKKNEKLRCRMKCAAEVANGRFFALGLNP